MLELPQGELQQTKNMYMELASLSGLDGRSDTYPLLFAGYEVGWRVARLLLLYVPT